MIETFNSLPAFIQTTVWMGAFTAFGFILIMLKIGMKVFLINQVLTDVILTILAAWVLSASGTISGMMGGMVAGIIISLFIFAANIFVGSK